MGLFIQRALLLLLLACDWAGDPYIGRSPLSQPLSSQPVVCHTVRLTRSVAYPQFDVRPLAVLQADQAQALPQTELQPGLSEPGPVPLAERLVYRLRSLRR
jgi:hypothetical protein